MSCRSRSWIPCSGGSGDIRIVRHTVVQIVGFPFAEQRNYERKGLSWSESLSWSETSHEQSSTLHGLSHLFLTRKTHARDGAKCDSVSRATTQEPIKTTMGKGVEKTGSTAGGKLSWLPGLLSFCLVVGLCVWVLVLRLFGPSLCWVLGGGLGCPGPLPSWLAAAPVFLVPAAVLAFVRKGDVPRTDPVVPLPVRASFRYTQVSWRYCGGTVTIALFALLGGIVVFYSPPLISRHRLCLTLYFLRHSYFLDRDERDLGCKSRNFPATLTIGEGLDAMKVNMSQILYSS